MADGKQEEALVTRPRGGKTNCTAEEYDRLYERSLADPDTFWGKQAERVDWIEEPSTICNSSFDPVDIKWYEGGKLNLCHNCVDRHVEDGKGDVTALIWEADEPGEVRRLSYKELHEEVQRFANVLKDMGVAKGDRVTLYMPMILEGAIAMLTCARIGAVHSVVFGGFSPDALAGRIEDCDSRFLITADAGVRASKTVPLKKNADAALDKLSFEVKTLVIRHRGEDVAMKEGRDIWYDETAKDVSPNCPCEEMDAEDPLFILYTSGSTGKPKGVMVEHRNAANFFVGMDARIPHGASGQDTWLAVTSLSFDISVLELFWTLARGFRVVVHRERERVRAGSTREMAFGLFYWGNDDKESARKYELLLEGGRYQAIQRATAPLIEPQQQHQKERHGPECYGPGGLGKSKRLECIHPGSLRSTVAESRAARAIRTRAATAKTA